MGGFIAVVAYPSFVIMMACGLIIYLNTTVFTQFRVIKPVEQWPDAGKQLVAIANVVEDWWWIVILLVIALIIVMNRLMMNYIGEFRPSS